MEVDLKEKLIAKLEEHYGSFEILVSKFGTTSFGQIANDLCISPSLFSKLIAGTATEGMYLRALENVDRLIKSRQLEHINSELSQKVEDLQNQAVNTAQITHEIDSTSTVRIKKQPYLLIALTCLIVVLIGIIFSLIQEEPEAVEQKITYTHPLSKFFDGGVDKVFDSGYLSPEEIQNYCPSSAYEGKWKLHKPYKLPLPGSSKPGVYMVAKSADIRMKTSRSDNQQGNVLLGYEHLIHEIWVDKERRSISPEFFNEDTKSYTSEFEKLNFDSNDRFVKVATMESFFIDRFFIYPDSIVRKGEPAGRLAQDINHELAKKYQIDVKFLIRDVVSNLTKTRCNQAVNPFCNPNDLHTGSTFSFECLYSINLENLGFGGGYPYTKTYELVEQNYADKISCSCPND